MLCNYGTSYVVGSNIRSFVSFAKKTDAENKNRFEVLPPSVTDI